MKKPSGKDGGRKPPDDENSLWSLAAQSIEPLKRKKSRVRVASDEVIVPRAPTPEKSAPKPAAEPAKAKRAEHPAPSPPKREAPPPPIAAFDRKKVKRIRAGRVEIEGRVDLHGLRQDEAHALLASFLRRSQSMGKRVVLVITGKGKVSDDDRERPFDMTVSRDRGVLKRNVPRWLDEPELRGLVVSYTTAAQHHGGDGALYVHLRKRDGS